MLKRKSPDRAGQFGTKQGGYFYRNTHIDVEAKKSYIAFKKDRNIVDFEIQNKGIKLWLNAKKGSINDSKNLTDDKSGKGHWGNGDYVVSLKDTENLEYIMSLIKQIANK